MERIDFFNGERVIGPHTVNPGDVKGRLTCTVVEEWVRRKAWSIACGEKRRYVLKKALGVSISQRRELESLVSSSLKLTGISALKAEIKAKLGLEIRIDETIDEEDEFSFEAPKCGRLDYTVYQLRRKYNFIYEDRRSLLQRLPRVWTDNSFSKVAEEWVDEIYGHPLPNDPDPVCRCKNPKPQYDGLVNLLLGKVGLLVGYKHNGEVIEFPALNYSVQARTIDDVLHTEMIFDRKLIPEYLLFLADEQRSRLTGWFSPYVEFRQKRYARQVHGDDSLNVIYFLIGGGIGAIIALLFAPKRGQEVRGDIKQLGERAGEYYESTRQTATVGQAIDAGKRAYQEEKRKTELSGRMEAAPKYDETTN